MQRQKQVASFWTVSRYTGSRSWRGSCWPTLSGGEGAPVVEDVAFFACSGPTATWTERSATTIARRKTVAPRPAVTTAGRGAGLSSSSESRSRLPAAIRRSGRERSSRRFQADGMLCIHTCDWWNHASPCSTRRQERAGCTVGCEDAVGVSRGSRTACLTGGRLSDRLRPFSIFHSLESRRRIDL